MSAERSSSDACMQAVPNSQSPGLHAARGLDKRALPNRWSEASQLAMFMTLDLMCPAACITTADVQGSHRLLDSKRSALTNAILLCAGMGTNGCVEEMESFTVS